MNQIPSEGEFCGECPCCAESDNGVYCGLYDYHMGPEGYQALRLPICLQERPQIVKDAKGGLTRFAGKEREKWIKNVLIYAKH